MPQTEIATFRVPHIQVLDEHGALDESLEPDLDEPTLVRLYEAMVLARVADERMLKLQRQGRIGTFPPTTGHEAAVCGAMLAMESQDWLVATYRELGARLMRGEPLENTLRYYSGYEEGSSLPAEARVLPIQVILGSQLLHAVGIAYAARLRGEADTAVVGFVGDGATSQGDFYEALNFAAVWQVPVVFLAVNNQWAISTPRSAQTRAQTIAQKAIAAGMDGIQIDGNDALAVYRVTKEALDRARAGQGPTLIEAVTYRLMMHTTADDPSKYRPSEEEQQWWQRDPIPRLSRYLQNKGIWSDARDAKLHADVEAQVAAAVERFEAPMAFKPDAPFDHVFGTSSPELERQRAAFLAELQRETGNG